ncbi:hypothetical protein Ancab_018844, partial [Ancistrocladus abbreviatus]
RNWKPLIHPTHHPTGSRHPRDKTFPLLAISRMKACFSFSHVSDTNEAAAIHCRKGIIDPKTKVQDQIGRSGDFVCAFNDPLPCLDNLEVEEIQNMTLDDGTFNVAVGTHDETYCKEAEDAI